MSDIRQEPWLSEKLRYWRAERPDEWTMDEFIRGSERLEAAHKAQQAEMERITKIKDLALAYIKECPCDPDIYPEQLAAWQKLQAALEGNQ